MYKVLVSVILSSPCQLTKRTDSIIREGHDFQVKVDDLDSSTKSENDDYPDKDICVWRTPKSQTINDVLLMDYCRFTKEHFGINMEQVNFLQYFVVV